MSEVRGGRGKRPMGNGRPFTLPRARLHAAGPTARTDLSRRSSDTRRRSTRKGSGKFSERRIRDSARYTRDRRNVTRVTPQSSRDLSQQECKSVYVTSFSIESYELLERRDPHARASGLARVNALSRYFIDTRDFS